MPSPTAHALWQAWCLEQRQEGTGPWPFCELVEQLLGQRTLNEAVDDVFEIQPPPGSETDLMAMAERAQALADNLPLPLDPQAPMRERAAQLIAIPMGGHRGYRGEPPTLDGAFWGMLESHLHAIFVRDAQRPLGEPLDLHLFPMPRLIPPEVAAHLTLDGQRQLILELISGEEGVSQQQMDALMQDLPDHRAAPTLDEYLAVAVLVYDQQQLPEDADIAYWLDQVDATAPDWGDDFIRNDCWTFAPRNNSLFERTPSGRQPGRVDLT